MLMYNSAWEMCRDSGMQCWTAFTCPQPVKVYHVPRWTKAHAAETLRNLLLLSNTMTHQCENLKSRQCYSMIWSWLCMIYGHLRRHIPALFNHSAIEFLYLELSDLEDALNSQIISRLKNRAAICYMKNVPWRRRSLRKQQFCSEFGQKFSWRKWRKFYQKPKDVFRK